MPERQQPRSISYSSSRPEILTVKGTAKTTWFDLQTARPKLVPEQVPFLTEIESILALPLK
jgi:predicted NUDIX family NTP pyrophosphohydrolase